MATNDKPYTVIGSRTRMSLDDMDKLIEVVEVKFTWGDNNEATLSFNKLGITPEKIREHILKHIALFDGL